MLQKNDTFELEVEEVIGEPEKKGSSFIAFIITFIRAIFQLILMVAILYGGFLGMEKLIEAKVQPPKRPPFKTVYTVDTIPIKVGDFQPKMVVYGEVQAAKSVELRSLVEGKITQVNPKLQVGGKVDEGEILFQVDKFDYETAVGGAKSNATETKARIAENEAMIAIEEARITSLKEQLVLAQSDLDRIKLLQSRGSATPRSVEERELIVSQRSQALQQSELNLAVEKARIEQLKAVLARFQRGIQQAKRDLKDTAFVSPMSGVIRENNAAVGRLIGSNDMIISMYRDDLLEARFTLTDQRFGRIQSDETGLIGRAVEVIWVVGGEEFRYPATIDRIGAQITSDRGGVEVIARIDGNLENGLLRPGAFVEVIVPDKAFRKNYKVPETALYDNTTVYVDVDGKLQSRKVKVLARDGDAIIIDGELADGDKVLVTRIAEISDDLNVRAPQPAPQPQQQTETGS